MSKEKENMKTNLEWQELLRLSKEEINEFAYIVSHDLKAPLRSVTSLAKWIHDDHVEALNEEGKEQLKLLLEAVTNLTKLFDGVLEYSRAGRITNASTLVDLKELVTELTAEFNSNIKIIVHPAPALYGEAVKMKQLFKEILRNAVEALPAEGGCIEISGKSDNQQAHYIISDNGCGLDAKFHKSVFQIFRKGPVAQPTEHIGLGLSVAKRIVEAHAGKIWVESNVSGGLAVHVILPEQNF